MLGIEYVFHINPDISQKEIADKLGVNHKTLNNWVKGRSKVPEKYLDELAEIFDFPKAMFNKSIDFKSIASQHNVQYIDEFSEPWEIYNSRIVLLQGRHGVTLFKTLKEKNGLIYVDDPYDRGFVFERREVFEIVRTRSSSFYRRLRKFVSLLETVISEKVVAPEFKETMLAYANAIHIQDVQMMNFVADYHCDVDSGFEEIFYDLNSKSDKDLAAKHYYLIELFGRNEYGQTISAGGGYSVFTDKADINK